MKGDPMSPKCLKLAIVLAALALLFSCVRDSGDQAQELSDAIATIGENPSKATTAQEQEQPVAETETATVENAEQAIDLQRKLNGRVSEGTIAEKIISRTWPGLGTGGSTGGPKNIQKIAEGSFLEVTRTFYDKNGIESRTEHYSFTFNPSTLQTTITGSNGFTSVSTFDAQGNLLSVQTTPEPGAGNGMLYTFSYVPEKSMVITRSTCTPDCAPQTQYVFTLYTMQNNAHEDWEYTNEYDPQAMGWRPIKHNIRLFLIPLKETPIFIPTTCWIQETSYSSTPLRSIEMKVDGDSGAVSHYTSSTPVKKDAFLIERDGFGNPEKLRFQSNEMVITGVWSESDLKDPLAGQVQRLESETVASCLGEYCEKTSMQEKRSFTYTPGMSVPLLPPPDLAIPFLGTGLQEGQMPSLLFLNRGDILFGNHGIGLAPLF